jgi:beta-N-acetylhexosaminidase
MSYLALTGCARGENTLPQPMATPAPPMPLGAPSGTPTPTPTEAPALSPSTVEARADALLSQMTLEQKVGQLFVVFFDGTEYADPLDRTIRELNVGGIILFEPNIGSLEDTATLINSAQRTAMQHGALIPLIVAVDHEGGLINRFGDKLTWFPSNMALAATHSLDHARAEARVMAEELSTLGINMNLAPVMDVNSNPDNPVIGIRSFGSNPEDVARLGAAMIDAFQANGIIATAKHFPGHGDTSVDSHNVLPVIPHDRTRLDTVELVPFRAAIEADVDAIMTAHIALPEIEPTPGLPATLTGLLREELGFNGLIATDSLGMGALDQTFGVTEASARAFQAGADLLMYGADPGHTPAEQYAAYQNLLALLRDGTIPRSASTPRFAASCWSRVRWEFSIGSRPPHRRYLRGFAPRNISPWPTG